MPKLKEKQYVEMITYFRISYIFNPFNYAYPEISIIDYFWIQNFVKFSLAFCSVLNTLSSYRCTFRCEFLYEMDKG